ncbi:uncharacterized protein SCHCODRAFT_02642807 [Schizophyllum commune H4-8]|nr:uncharacterized protein SCHCODRAFT_02642807 [Schizophyllum commune H4-8]KAI5885920.1 hypothetical protein SCHCODRAFT_02642807 [Schizophyllum commune H4-8]
MSGYTVPAERPHDGIRFVYSEGKPTVVAPRRPYQERASSRDRIYEPKAAPSSTERARKTQDISPVGENQDQYLGYSLGSALSSGSSVSVPNSTSQQYTNSDPFSSDLPLSDYGTSSSWPYLPWSTSNDTLGDIDMSYLNALDGIDNRNMMPPYQQTDFATMYGLLRGSSASAPGVPDANGQSFLSHPAYLDTAPSSSSSPRNPISAIPPTSSAIHSISRTASSNGSSSTSRNGSRSSTASPSGSKSDALPVARPQVTTGAIARASSKRRSREVPNDSDIRCPHCGSTFTKRHNLRNHIRSHLDLREYVCQRCQAAFNNPGGLYRHRRAKGACVIPGEEGARSHSVE